MATAKLNNWTVGKLLGEVNNIIKPRIQRDQCWTPEKEDSFIDFIKSTGCFVAPIIFVENGDGKLFIIDGNNRLNAVSKHICEEIQNIEIPVVIFSKMTGPALADLYKRINTSSVLLTRDDLIAATDSLVVYDSTTVPLYHNIRHYAGLAISSANAREVLQVALDEHGLTRREVLTGFRGVLSSRWEIAALLGDSWLAEAADAIPISIAEFVNRVCDVFYTLGGLSDRFYPDIGCRQLRGNIVELKPHMILFAVYAHLRGTPIGTIVRCLLYSELTRGIKSKIAGVQNPVAVYVKAFNPIERHRLVKNPPSNAGLTPIVAPTDDNFRYLIGQLLKSLDNPTEAGSKKERSKIPFVYAILLGSYHKTLYMLRLEHTEREIEHIIPYSTTWARGVKINIHRLGNLTVLDREANQSRGNRELTSEIAPPGLPYPTLAEYVEIVDKRRLLSPEKYKSRCETVEEAYVSGLLMEYK